MCGIKTEFVPEGMTAPPESFIKQPELQVYLTDFGKKKDDVGLMAEIQEPDGSRETGSRELREKGIIE